MKPLSLAAATLAAVSLPGAAALATDEWKTVTLRGEPGLTISIPTVAGDIVAGKDSDDLMFLSLTANDHGSLVCIANRFPYPKESPRSVFAAALATERRNVFCNQDKPTVGNLDIGESQSFDHHGSNAAVCTASYTDSAEELPGRVSSQMIVAATGKAYVLTCTVEDEDQETAEYSWSTLWADKVRRIQDSFRIPK
jgi:hypothetical protein